MTTSNIDEQDPLLGFNFNSDDQDDPSAMSLVDHLEELRKRIFVCLIAIAIATVIAFIFRQAILNLLESPLPQHVNALAKTNDGKNLVVTGVAEGFTVFLMISLAAGVVIALPVILYELWAFIAPGLYEREKKYAVPFIFIGVGLLAIGITVGYIVLRFPLQWLVTFAASNFTELITADSYFTFVAFFILAFGIVFELPLVITFLAKVGIVNIDTLKKKRAAAHVGMWIAATFLTPGADLYSPVILGVCMSFLYEITIIFIHFTVKPAPALE